MKRLINCNVKNLLETSISNSEVECVPYKFCSYENIGIGAICISINKDEYYLHLNSEITKQYFSKWKSGIGGIITRLFKHKKYDNFYEIFFDKYKVLAYKPDDFDSLVSEVDANNANRTNIDDLDVVTIGDFKYIIIHTATKDGFYSNVCNDTDENYVPSETNLFEIDEEIKNSQENEKDLESISLF